MEVGPVVVVVDSRALVKTHRAAMLVVLEVLVCGSTSEALMTLLQQEEEVQASREGVPVEPMAEETVAIGVLAPMALHGVVVVVLVASTTVQGFGDTKGEMASEERYLFATQSLLHQVHRH